MCQLQCDYLSKNTWHKNLCSRSCNTDGLLLSLRTAEENKTKDKLQWHMVGASDFFLLWESEKSQRKKKDEKKVFHTFVHLGAYAIPSLLANLVQSLAALALLWKPTHRETCDAQSHSKWKKKREKLFALFLCIADCFKNVECECRCDRNKYEPQI